MATWQNYPAAYRGKQVQEIECAALAGESVALVGLSGAGKSNLLGFLANRCSQPGRLRFVLLDCNRLDELSVPALFRLARRELGDVSAVADELLGFERVLEQALAQGGVLCLLLDRFDALASAAPARLLNNLRALRDSYKYLLSFVIATRRPLDAQNELAELVFGHVIWLGTLTPEDARWSAEQFARRRGLGWGVDVFQALAGFSGGYPSFLRGACEAYAEGAALASDALRQHPAVQRRLEEFWSDQPDSDSLSLSGLAGHPWLIRQQPASVITENDLDTLSAQLTAKEHRLLVYLQAHPGEVCEKDDLIRAVWPEDRVFVNGIRDDSLAQLVRRLRKKIEPDPDRPEYIHTLPGRGYRFTPR